MVVTTLERLSYYLLLKASAPRMFFFLFLNTENSVMRSYDSVGVKKLLTEMWKRFLEIMKVFMTVCVDANIVAKCKTSIL